jgi:hypothetical protein
MGNATTKDKVFLNVVQSDKILKPSKTTTPKGDCWSVPYSLGPPHMERDKKGENATCFDCCFHPEAIILGELNAEFKKLLVSTAMEGVDEFYKRTSQKVQIDRDFHVVKGISYKEGQIPTMLIATASKNAWDEKKEKKNESTTGITSMKSPTKPGEISSGIKHKNDPPASTSDDEKPPAKTTVAKPAAVSSDSNSSTTASSPAKPSTKAAPAIKKGFLVNAKNKPGLYDEKIQTIRPRNQPESISPVPPPSSAIHEEKDSKKSQEEELIKKLNNSLSFDGSKPTEAAKPITDNELKAVATKRREKPVESSSSVPVPAPVKPIVSEKPKIVEEVKQPPVVVEKKKKDEEKEKAAVGGPVEPVVVCKHREEIALGDFQGMQHEIVKSGRPNELVYEIQLPLVTAPSKIVLDVAEQQISLSYLDIYKLDMKLPYKVNDKKGKAAYDKSKKALKVTLPVIADFITVSSASTFVPPAPEPAKLVEEVKNNNSKEKEEENEEKSPEKPTAIPQTRAAKKAAEKEASHNRWVDSSSSETVNDPAKEESKKLYEDIKRQAEIAQANALKEKKEKENSRSLPPVRSAATVTVSSTSSSSTTAVAPPAAPTLEELMKEEDNHHHDHQKGEPQEYIPSVKFIGARKGYFFATGVRGLGYYLDKPKQPQQPQEKQKEEEKKPANEKEKKSEKTVEKTPSVATTTLMRNYQLPPLEVKQTKAAISVLFQAPQILKDSVHVDCISDYLIDVSFQAPSSSSTAEVVSYGVRLHLDEKSCLDGVDKEKMEFDVASKNMALVLMKKSHQIFGSNSVPDIIKLPAEKGEENKKTWISFQELQSTADLNNTTTSNEQELQKDKATTKTATGAKASKENNNKSKSAASEAIQSTVNALRFNTDFINELD